MKVGTDGVLLGAWADVRNAKSILDIGTGSGLIALMLAQRTGPDVRIDAVEIALRDFQQASDNVHNSPWSGRVGIFHQRIQEFSPNKKYDLIVSNPPFFHKSTSPPTGSRKQARHTDSMPYNDLLSTANELLSRTGKLCVILPTVEGTVFEAMAVTVGLHTTRSLAFFSRREKKQERWLLELRRTGLKTPPESLVLYEGTDAWSPEYRKLIREFYLAI